MNPDKKRALFVISAAAELAGMHPQTLRIYERRGLIDPQRTPGGTRRYSQEDIERLTESSAYLGLAAAAAAAVASRAAVAARAAS